MESTVCTLLFVFFLFPWCNAWQQNVVHMSQQSTKCRVGASHDGDVLQSSVHGQPQRNFSFASYYGDHMVLQKAPQRATVWGFHPEPGARIILQLTGRKLYSAVVDEQGVWKVLLEPESSSDPFKIVALSETETIFLKDVLFGDVWLCSGQSNMEFTLSMALNFSEEIEEAKNYQDVRVFTAQLCGSSEPLVDLKLVMEKWSRPNMASLGDGSNYFSAICWLYGKYLYQQLGYPIGLIASSYGGTPVEFWMSEEALKKCGDSPDSKTVANMKNLKLMTAQVENELPHSKPEPLAVELDYGQLWNAMIYPFLPLTIYGVIWDQGENDAYPSSFRNNYNCTFPTMIEDWRSKFSQAGQTKADFPFGFVQIGPSSKDPVTSTGYPDVRWHQTADYGYVPNPKMRNVFMSVSMDITHFLFPFGNVHTPDKQDIAHRLFLGGLDIAYNISTTWKGPLPVSMTQSLDTLILNYGSAWTLEIKQNEGFEFCCSLNGSQQCRPSEGRAWWVPTPITNNNATHIEIYSGVCGATSNILGLRYAWRLSPCNFKKCAVYSKENSLPAPIFVMYFNGQELQANSVFEFDWSKPTRIQ